MSKIQTLIIYSSISQVQYSATVVTIPLNTFNALKLTCDLLQ